MHPMKKQQKEIQDKQFDEKVKKELLRIRDGGDINMWDTRVAWRLVRKFPMTIAKAKDYHLKYLSGEL